MDETGIDTYLYREYGYAPRGKPVIADINGRKYARVGIVAAQLGHAIIAPFKYSGTMNGTLFEQWFEDQLLPELPEGTVIVMDNASFHRKTRLLCIEQKHNRHIIFLPQYSPELNPIEHFWAWLKRHLKKTLTQYPSFSEALSAAFQVR